MRKEKCPFNKRETPPCNICETQSWKETYKQRYVPKCGNDEVCQSWWEDNMQFIQSLLSENTDDILRKFATGDFIKTPLAKKFEKQIRQEIMEKIDKEFKWMERDELKKLKTRLNI